MMCRMTGTDLAAIVERVALETSFSGAVRVDVGDELVFACAYGDANRPARVANTVDTQFALASGVKGMTALTVVSLIEQGVLAFETTARWVLGDDLPLIANDVTVEHLLANRSGIGDYLDEDIDRPITDYAMNFPVHQLVTTEQFLAVLDGFPTQFPAGERFKYCNAGFVVLALIAERVSGATYHELVRERVCKPAGMDDTVFLRMDELPARAAIGYLWPSEVSDRTNVLHMPVLANGDGGIFSTVGDVRKLWRSFVNGEIVTPDHVARMLQPRSDASPEYAQRYGLGFWLQGARETIMLKGYDAGVSFRSAYDPSTEITYTVVSNSSEGAWPVSYAIEDEWLPPSSSDSRRRYR
jgi:CubicO group peptidase (beta-lactamase class C family)